MSYQFYLSKHAVRPGLINSPPMDGLKLIVVIPAHDERSVLKPLRALQACQGVETVVEVLVVFNASMKADKTVLEQNKYAAQEASLWYAGLHDPIYNLHIIEENQLEPKHAGVGLARKIGMDEAVRRFDQVEEEHGVIICFDADSSCDNNYLKSISDHFDRNPRTQACSIYFEHPINGNEFMPNVYEGIIYYELHLRYYKNALDFANMPFAYHTIGSSMAVKAREYCKQGGMNKRKAGEDFYFLQKFIKLKQFSELGTTRVIPSPRQSHRVPFGTGRAIQEMINEERNIKESYAWQSFKVLKEAFSNVDNWYTSEVSMNPYLVEFMGKVNFNKKIEEIRAQSTNKDRFVKRLFHWFDAFQALKFMHFLRDHYFENQKLEESVPRLLEQEGRVDKDCSPRNLLWQLRTIDRGA